jgi:RNA recognition motif-containing protein
MKLWIGNIAPGTSEEDLRELIRKYGATEVASVEHVPGDGSRPGAFVEIAAAPELAQRIVQRLNGMYWKGRSLTVQATTSRETS